MNKKELLYKSLEANSPFDDASDADVALGFIGETEEYIEARELCFLGDDPQTLAQEGADVLLFGYELHKRGILTEPCRQACLKVLLDFELTGIDYVDAMLQKETRNRMKYAPTPMNFNGFTFNERMKLSKQAWEHMTDQAFYFMYMQLSQEMYPDENV